MENAQPGMDFALAYKHDNGFGFMFGSGNIIYNMQILEETVARNKGEWEEQLQQFIMACQNLSKLDMNSYAVSSKSGSQQLINPENKTYVYNIHNIANIINANVNTSGAKAGQYTSLENLMGKDAKSTAGRKQANNRVAYNLENILPDSAAQKQGFAPYKSDNLEKFLEAGQLNGTNRYNEKTLGIQNAYAQKPKNKTNYVSNEAQDKGFARAPYKSNNLERFLEAYDKSKQQNAQNHADRSYSNVINQNNNYAKQKQNHANLERILPKQSNYKATQQNKEFARAPNKSNNLERFLEAYDKSKQQNAQNHANRSYSNVINQNNNYAKQKQSYGNLEKILPKQSNYTSTQQNKGFARAPYKSNNLQKVLSQSKSSYRKEPKTGELYTNTAKKDYNASDFRKKTQPIEPNYSVKPNNYQATQTGGMKPGNNYMENFRQNPRLSQLPNYANPQTLPKQDSGLNYGKQSALPSQGMKGLPPGTGTYLKMPQTSYAGAKAGKK